jgi:hypothetical protein
LIHFGDVVVVVVVVVVVFIAHGVQLDNEVHPRDHTIADLGQLPK